MAGKGTLPATAGSQDGGPAPQRRRCKRFFRCEQFYTVLLQTGVVFCKKVALLERMAMPEVNEYEARKERAPSAAPNRFGGLDLRVRDGICNPAIDRRLTPAAAMLADPNLVWKRAVTHLAIKG